MKFNNKSILKKITFGVLQIEYTTNNTTTFFYI